MTEDNEHPRADETPEDRGDAIEFNSGEEMFSLADADAAINKAAEPPAQDKEPPQSIPFGRFREVNDKAKALAEENQTLRQQLEDQRKPLNDEEIRIKNLKFIELINDGDWDQAAQLKTELDLIMEQRAAQRARTALDADAHYQQALAVSERIWQENPWLRENEEAQEDFKGWRNIAEARGFSQVEALDFALGKVKPLYGGDDKPPSFERPDTRKENALSRGMRDAKRQPPVLQGTGARAHGQGRVDYTDTELAKLPKEQLARLRGDYPD